MIPQEDDQATGESGIDERYRDFEVDPGYRYLHDRGQQVGWFDYGSMWLISGYSELARALRDDETFSSVHDLPNGCTRRQGVMYPATSIRSIPIEIDPPEYLGYRRLLAPRFAPPAVRALVPLIRQYTTWCIDNHIESGTMDLFHDLATLVPALVTMGFVGLPLEDSLIIATAVHARGAGRFDLNPAWRHLMRRIEEAAALRSARPGNDLISYLVHADLGGRKLTSAEITGICFGIVIGGMSTTAKLTLGALSYLGVHTADRARLTGDGALPVAMDEFLRYYTPVPFLCRTATRDVTIGGQAIKSGDRVAMGFAAANRDARFFPRPHEVVLDRRPNRHLAFGLGVHFCVGAGLGRTEASIMVQEVLRRMPGYRIASDYDPAAAPPRRQGTERRDTRGPSRRSRRMTWEDRMERGLTVTFAPGRRLGRGLDLAFAEPFAPAVPPRDTDGTPGTNS
jgi:cytochrome P450